MPHISDSPTHLLTTQHLQREAKSVPALVIQLRRFRDLVLCAGSFLFATGTAWGQVPDQFGNQFSSSIPSRSYFVGIEQLYQGEYRDAEQIFRGELRSAIKIGVTTRWIDTICYHTMLGETYYHQGRPALALEQFDHACAMFLQYPNWMLRVKFKDPRKDTNRLRLGIPWGASGRQFTLGNFATQMLISQGDLLSGNRAAQRGGVVTPAQFWQVNVVEIVRTTALAIRRRNELLGPLAAHDVISSNLVTALSRGAAPPNHWSNAWVDLQLGLAYVGQGKAELAAKRLQRAERVAGRYDHPLTCIALLEQGRLAMELGNTAKAANLLAEAGYSAYYYEDLGAVDESFRLASLNRLAGATQEINPALDPAAAWARRKGYDHIFSRLNLAWAEELMRAGNWEAAATALKTGQSRLQDARAGLLGSWAQYLAARVLIQQGKENAYSVLMQAVEQHRNMSTRNFQIDLTNRRFDSQQLKARSAVDVYHALLDDPGIADWVYRPLDSLTVLKTPHGNAFERWIAALRSRKDTLTALEVTDRAKRRRFHAVLAWGGRLASLRALLEADEISLSPAARNVRNDLLLRFPEYDRAKKEGRKIVADLRAQWVEGLDAKAQRNLVKVWRNWADSLETREAMLAHLAMERVPVDMQFPPLKKVSDVQAKLQPGQAVLVFHDTPEGVLGFLVTFKATKHWNCGPAGKINSLVTKFLQDIGNYGANHDLTAEQLQADDWIPSGQKLYQALFRGSSIDPQSLDELIVVPDGVIWYVPFGALPVKTEDQILPMISTARVRIVPTLGLAVGNLGQGRRVQHSALVGSEILPGESDEAKQPSLDLLKAALIRPMELPSPPPVAIPTVGSLLETLVVLDEQEIDPAQPLAWSPLPAGKSARHGSLSDWLRLPQFGPQWMILPAVRTIAEQGGRASKRRSATAPPGSELFLASCGLMSTGAQTILLSRWRVGGDTTVELVREFVQELPHTSPTDAWQRSVQLAMELPIDSVIEPRVKKGNNDPPLTASHPIFWSGYLLIDSGFPGPESTEKQSAAAANP